MSSLEAPKIRGNFCPLAKKPRATVPGVTNGLVQIADAYHYGASLLAQFLHQRPLFIATVSMCEGLPVAHFVAASGRGVKAVTRAGAASEEAAQRLKPLAGVKAGPVD